METPFIKYVLFYFSNCLFCMQLKYLVDMYIKFAFCFAACPTPKVFFNCSTAGTGESGVQCARTCLNPEPECVSWFCCVQLHIPVSYKRSNIYFLNLRVDSMLHWRCSSIDWQVSITVFRQFWTVLFIVFLTMSLCLLFSNTCDFSLFPSFQGSIDCESGCLCPTGLLDDGKGSCVKENECPCQHNGHLYAPGTEIPNQCNKWYDFFLLEE